MKLISSSSSVVKIGLAISLTILVAAASFGLFLSGSSSVTEQYYASFTNTAPGTCTAPYASPCDGGTTVIIKASGIDKLGSASGIGLSTGFNSSSGTNVQFSFTWKYSKGAVNAACPSNANLTGTVTSVTGAVPPAVKINAPVTVALIGGDNPGGEMIVTVSTTAPFYTVTLHGNSLLFCGV
jgi:hypothetical protein